MSIKIYQNYVTHFLVSINGVQSVLIHIDIFMYADKILYVLKNSTENLHFFRL